MKKLLTILLTLLVSLSSVTFVFADDSDETNLVYVVTGDYEWSIPASPIDVSISTTSGSVEVTKAILEEYELLQISIDGGKHYMDKTEGHGSSLKYNMQLEDRKGGYIDGYYVSYKIEQDADNSNAGDTTKPALLRTGEISKDILLISVPAGQNIDENGKLKTPVVETLNFTKTTSDVIYAGNYKDILTFIAKVQSLFSIHREINNESTAWIRDDNLTEGFTVKASTDGTNYCSYYDILPIYKDIKRVVLDLDGKELLPGDPGYEDGDVMVKIPKFYYQRFLNSDGNTEYINISPIEQTGYDLHPAFIRNDSEGISHNLDYIYLGAYKTDKDSSKPDVKIEDSKGKNRGHFRTYVKDKNPSDSDGWSIIDASTLSAIQMLILVEYADNDVQSLIGQGVSFKALKTDVYGRMKNTGTCDELYERGQITGSNGGDGRNDVLWRGIEGFWGNSGEYTDGLNYYNGTYYICNDIFKYVDDTEDNYTALSYTVPTNITQAYAIQQGVDENNAWCMVPTTISQLSDSVTSSFGVNYPDRVSCSSANWGTYSHGGSTYDDKGSGVGLFCLYFNIKSTASAAYPHNCSRIQYLPLP